MNVASAICANTKKNINSINLIAVINELTYELVCSIACTLAGKCFALPDIAAVLS